MAPGRAPEVLIVSLGSTAGLRAADAQLLESLRRAGADAELASARAPRERRTLMLTDLAWSRAARAAARAALGGAREAPARAPAIVYSSTTAALLWPAPGAIRFDAPASANRPGRHGLWQRPLERRRLAAAPLLLPWSAGALEEARAGGAPCPRALVVPVAVERPGAASPARDIAAITYAANPVKKGLARVLDAWHAQRARGPADTRRELVVAGASEHELRRAGMRLPAEGVRVAGRLERGEYRALLSRARVFVCAPEREDYGIAQLEALAAGCMLVTTAAPGAYAALPIARALDARLVGEDLRAALRAALEEPRAGYAERAAAALEPYGSDALDALVAAELLPRLRELSARPRAFG